MEIHSSTLAWRIPWTEEPDGLQSMGWQRVGHSWVTNTHNFIYLQWNCFYLYFRGNFFFFFSWRIIVSSYAYAYLSSLSSLPPTPHPTPLELPSWAPCAPEQLPSSHLFCTWQRMYVSAAFSLSHPLLPCCVCKTILFVLSVFLPICSSGPFF